MKFKSFKEWLADKGIDETAYSAKTATEMAQLQKEYMQYASEEMKKAVESGVTKDALTEATKGLVKEEAIKGFLTKDSKEFKDFETRIKEAEEKAAMAIEGNGGSESTISFKEAIRKELLKNKDALKSMKDDPNASLVIKAPVAMTFATNTTGNVGRTERESGFQDTFRRTPILLEIVNTTNTNAKTFEWIEKTGRDGGVAMVPEGGLKPQGDWDLSLFSQSAKKDALIVTVSKEMLEDIDGMAQDIEDEVFEQIRLFSESIALNGDGTGNNIIGMDANAVPFVAGSFANTIQKANEFDALRVAYNQVELTHDTPTGFLLHPTDAAKMELVKDETTGQYIMPPFAASNGTSIKGLPVRTSTLVTEGEAYVGNFKRFKIKLRSGIEFTMGYRGAQGDWEKNMVSFLGEQRLFGFIPAVHYASIVKVDFAVAKALLDPNVADA